MQAAYLSAFAKIGTFEGRSSLSTWLTRIVINEALGRRRSEAAPSPSSRAGGSRRARLLSRSLMRGSEAECARCRACPRADPQAARTGGRRAARQLPHRVRAARDRRPQQRRDRRSPRRSVGHRENAPLPGRRRLQQMLAPDLGTALSGTFPFAGSRLRGADGACPGKAWTAASMRKAGDYAGPSDIC